MMYASTFLSHSSVDKLLVAAVARELGRRGIIAWLDKNELQVGTSLSAALTEAIQRQATVTIFLSPASLASSWVEDELAVALQQEEQLSSGKLIMPIYLGNPLQLVSSHPLLRSRWLHPDGDRVNRLGIVPNKDAELPLLAREIAVEVAQKIYSVLKIADSREIIIYLDQRGVGPRRGEPQDVPEHTRVLNAPALVFRPDLGTRRPDEILYGYEWQEARLAMETALSAALGIPRWPTPKKIRLLGNAQLGFPFILGQHFNRNTNAHLFCTNMDGYVFNNQEQPRYTPIPGGDPQCETSHPDIPPIATHPTLESIALLLSTESYVAPVRRYLQAHSDAPPLVWVRSGLFTTSPQVMTYVADVVALLMRLNTEYGLRTVNLYCGLPFHVVPILAANLLHVVENVIFMEYRRDLQGKNPQVEDTYVPLSNERS